MGNKQFESVLQMIVASLVDMIATKNKLPEDEALNRLYSSSLYAALESEDTKVWHYSASKLYELFQAEAQTGKLYLPEY